MLNLHKLNLIIYLNSSVHNFHCRSSKYMITIKITQSIQNFIYKFEFQIVESITQISLLSFGGLLPAATSSFSNGRN